MLLEYNFIVSKNSFQTDSEVKTISDRQKLRIFCFLDNLKNVIWSLRMLYNKENNIVEILIHTKEQRVSEVVNRLVSIKQQSCVNSWKLFQENQQHIAVFVLLRTMHHNGGVVKKGT